MRTIEHGRAGAIYGLFVLPGAVFSILGILLYRMLGSESTFQIFLSFVLERYGSHHVLDQGNWIAFLFDVMLPLYSAILVLSGLAMVIAGIGLLRSWRTEIVYIGAGIGTLNVLSLPLLLIATGLHKWTSGSEATA